MIPLFRSRLWPLLVLALALAGCQSLPIPTPPAKESTIEPPPPVVVPPLKPVRPARVGLALGGGAARGFAHIGVIQVLEENGINLPNLLIPIKMLTPFAVEWRYDEYSLAAGQLFDRHSARDLVKKLRTWVESRMPQRTS